jgi:cysteine desulfurase / selenocysteine lyase
MPDPQAIRRQFPLLRRHPDLAYLDGAATSQKPDVVLDAMRAFYESDYANVHRGLFPLAERATAAYEGARETVRGFLNAAHADEIVFTRGTTEAINLVAVSLSRMGLFKDGDVVVLSRLEHHANVVPWLQLKERNNIEIRWIDIDDAGMPRMDELERALADGTVKIVGVTGLSNVLGVRPDVERVVALAHDAGAKVLVDAAQTAAHEVIDVQNIGCDFLAFSGHKIYGPTGIGVLYGRRELLREMPPFLGGGMMIRDVLDDSFAPADPPARFEAGTPPVAEAVGLAAAIEWLKRFDPADRAAHERELLGALLSSLKYIPGVRILGPGDADRIRGCVSVVVDGAHAHDVAELLGNEGICVRAGHHCAQPLHRRLGIAASTRISVSLHTTMEDIDRVAPAIDRARATLTGTR